MSEAPLATLEEDAHWLLARLARSFGSAEQQAIEHLGITLREYVVMTEVEAEPGRSQLAVARAAAVDKSMMVTAVDRLEARGLLLREAAPSDRRMRALFLTDEGRRVLAEATDAVRAAEPRLMAVLAPERRQHFLESLRLLVAEAADIGVRHRSVHLNAAIGAAAVCKIDAQLNEAACSATSARNLPPAARSVS
jgi:DNA-binding MarR family transcriptional regulator